MTALYKGIAIDPALAGLIRHMHDVEEYREVLANLQSGWDTLALLGELSLGAAEMSDTRQAFERLTGDLLNQLGVETKTKSLDGLRTKARNSIDILVRNLFERTADIGFLAADTEIRNFLESGGSDGRDALEARFREYVAKYSVYADIVLISAAGHICARLDAHPAKETSHDLLRETLSTGAAYVEFFGEADFLPDGHHLVYAYRVVGEGGNALGALALVFRLHDELESVFRNLLTASDWAVLATVSADNRVIASSCAIQLPNGLALPPGVAQADGDIVRIGGRQYLAVACSGAGYQGYGGPKGWVGLGLVPVEQAFVDDGAVAASIDTQALESILRESTLFPESLRAVPRQAAQIQRNLSRSVWNGSVKLAEASESSADFSKALLREMSNAGARTQTVFDQAISNLQQTVIAALLQNVQSRAAFAIDVMDRNLYERANDCRWWALDTTFRRALGEASREAAHNCAPVLAKINGLYTVYTNLILFDADGVIVAVSQPSESHRVGEKLDAEWTARTLALRTTQDYVVSAFEPSSLYGERATYIYAASVQHLESRQSAGGIAIVFDAAPQFAAMLSDALPCDPQGVPIAGSFALFLDRDGRVIASTDAAYRVGATASLGFDVSSLRNGEGVSTILTRDGQCWAIGAAMSAGYREYKRSDGYVSDIVSICAVPLSTATSVSGVRPSRAAHSVAAQPRRADIDSIEVATFRVGGHWLGVRADEVVEAIPADGITAAGQVGSGPMVGYKLHRDTPIPVLELARAIGATGQAVDIAVQQIVVVKTPNGSVGFLVDDLADIPQVVPAEIAPFEWNCEMPALGVVSLQGSGSGPADMLIILDLSRFGPGTSALQAAE